MDEPTIAPPIHVPLLQGPWHGVSRGLTEHGNAVVYTAWGEWFPAVLTMPGLRQLLGRDWVRSRRIADATERYRFVASRLLIKYTAAAALRTAPGSLDLAYRLGGRPYLRGLDQIELSLTHSGELMAVGLSRIGRIGVDLEHADRRIRFELIRDQMCTPAEAAELERVPDAERPARTLRLWTLKEAYTKALGQGRRLGFTEFGFSPDESRLLAPDGSPASRGEWAFATHRALGYLLTVACHDEGLDPNDDTAVGTMLDQGFLSAMLQPDPSEAP